VARAHDKFHLCGGNEMDRCWFWGIIIAFLLVLFLVAGVLPEVVHQLEVIVETIESQLIDPLLNI
jgi:hypothetical protein